MAGGVAVTPRPWWRSRVPLVLACLAVVIGSLWSGQAAQAHAVLVSSSPVDGSRLATSPAQVVLQFDERVQLVPSTAKVISASGSRADTDHARLSADATSVVIPLRPDLPRASYTATWRVVSADTHIVAGSISFGVRQNARVTGSAALPVTALDVVAGVAPGLGYLGVVLGLGVAGAGLLLWPSILRRRRTRMLLRIGWVGLLVGTLVELLLQGPRATGAGWSGVARFDDFGQTVASGYGIALLVRLGLLGLLVTLQLAPARRVVSAVRLLLAAGVLVTIALEGHAGVGSDAVIAVPAAVLHLAAMAIWLGGLLVLLVVVLPLLRRARRVNPRLLNAWSVTAFASVAVLIVTGEYQAWRQIQPVESLWSTPYGITLLIKLALVAVALAAAVVARRALPLPRGADGRSAFAVVRRSVWIEAIVVTLVVSVTTVLVSEPPPGSTYGPPVSLTAPLGADHLQVRVDTTHRGPETITVTGFDAAGKPVRLSSLAGTLSSDDVGIAALEVTFRRSGDGWRSVAANAPLPGTWTLTLDAALDPTTAYATSAKYSVW